MSKPVLYSQWTSSCVWRVRNALHLKGIGYEVKIVDIDNKKDQFSVEFTRLNPMRHVPAFSIGETCLYESIAILNFLEEAYPGTPLLPKDLVQRAKVRAFVDIVASGIQPLQNTKVLLKVKNDKCDEKEWGRYWISLGFEAVERILSSSSGKYCFGDEITLADCVLVPQVLNAKKFNVDFTPFPTICRINENLKEHKAFKLANPINQPDFPENIPENIKVLYQ
ncbi:GSTZ1.2 family protein [Megaselia abdita]